MKQIWEGDITVERHAWELHCLVSQIHAWAVSDFMPFVTAHLANWHEHVLALYQDAEDPSQPRDDPLLGM